MSEEEEIEEEKEEDEEEDVFVEFKDSEPQNIFKIKQYEFKEPTTPYEKRLYSVIKKLKEYENQVILRDQVYKILFEELSRFGILSNSSMREYYQLLRSLDIVRELGKERINGKLVMKVQVRADTIKNILYFDESYQKGLRCHYCGKEFKNKDKLKEHEDFYCKKNPNRYEDMV